MTPPPVTRRAIYGWDAKHIDAPKWALRRRADELLARHNEIASRSPLGLCDDEARSLWREYGVVLYWLERSTNDEPEPEHQLGLFEIEVA